jgi:hypothetical protein
MGMKGSPDLLLLIHHMNTAQRSAFPDIHQQAILQEKRVHHGAFGITRKGRLMDHLPAFLMDHTEHVFQ